MTEPTTNLTADSRSERGALAPPGQASSRLDFWFSRQVQKAKIGGAVALIAGIVVAIILCFTPGAPFVGVGLAFTALLLKSGVGGAVAGSVAVSAKALSLTALTTSSCFLPFMITGGLVANAAPKDQAWSALKEKARKVDLPLWTMFAIMLPPDIIDKCKNNGYFHSLMRPIIVDASIANNCPLMEWWDEREIPWELIKNLAEQIREEADFEGKKVDVVGKKYLDTFGMVDRRPQKNKPKSKRPAMERIKSSNIKDSEVDEKDATTLISLAHSQAALLRLMTESRDQFLSQKTEEEAKQILRATFLVGSRSDEWEKMLKFHLNNPGEVEKILKKELLSCKDLSNHSPGKHEQNPTQDIPEIEVAGPPSLPTLLDGLPVHTNPL